MTLCKIIQKIFDLGKKVKNPPFFWYSLHHYLKRDVSKRKAQKIRDNNIKSFKKEENEFLVTTYDGSNQCVHPDIALFEDKYWLVITPYPYGMEEYENPCVYCGDSIVSIVEMQENPIERQKRHAIGFHLSDPCIFSFGGRLICVYRENDRINGKVNSYLFCKTKDNCDNWSKPHLIIKSNLDPLLSPAMYSEKIDGIDNIHMIHVNRVGKNSYLIHSELDKNMVIKDSTIQKCFGMPDGYYIWHIAVSFQYGLKTGSGGDLMQGLFLLRNEDNDNKFRLFFATTIDRSEWIIKKEIVIPSSIRVIEYHPYKSCFIPNSSNILYSYVDNQNRYRLTILE